MKHHHYFAAIVAFLAFLPLFSGVSAGVSQAARADFTQEILPLECVVSTVQTGDSVTQSFSPTGCGTYVPMNTPTVGTGPSYQVSFRSTPTPFVGNFGVIDNGGQSMRRTFLNDLGSLYRKGGFLVRVREGDVVSFTTQSHSLKRGVEILRVTPHGMVVYIRPDNMIVRLVLGEKRVVEVTNSKGFKVFLTLEAVEQQGQVGYLRMRFPYQDIRDQVVLDSRYAIIMTVVIALLLITCSHLYHRYIRSPLDHKKWLNHHNEQ